MKLHSTLIRGTRGALLLFLVAICSVSAYAQQYLGTLAGEVSDPTSAKVANATVAPTETNTNFTTRAATNASGLYSIPFLNPGTYKITIEAPGFRTEARTGIVLTAGANQQVDFALKTGATTESVIVTSETALLDTGSPNIATTLSTKEVTDLPNVGRNPFVLATLAAGVLSGGSGGYFQGKSSQFTNPFSGVAVQLVSDGSSGHNRLTLNGIPTRNNRGGSLDDIHQFSSSLVLDSRFGLLYHPFGLTYPGSSRFDLSTIGISGAGLPYSTFPGIATSDGYATLAAGAGGQISTNTTGSLEEILTKSLGHHTIRFGFEGNLIRYNVQNPQSGFGNTSGPSGSQSSLSFDRRFTQQNSVTTPVGADPNSGDPIASLLLGAFSGASYNITPAYALQQIYAAPFVQDDWRATQKLTVNLGLRWDYESPFTERYNKQVSSFCLTCANPLQAAVSGLPVNGGLQFTTGADRFPYPRDLNNFQPRIGAAYQAFHNTVVRGGFGIIYFNTLESPIGTGFSQTTSYNNHTNSAPLNSLGNPFPTSVLLPSGSSLGMSTALGQSISFVDPHHVQPKSAQYSASVQQQFAGDLALQIAYVGSRPTRLEVNHNIDLLPRQYYNQGQQGVTYLTATTVNPLAGKLPQAPGLNGSTIARNLLLLPYPEFGSITEQYSPIGSAPYNALQVQISRPMKNHFSLQGNFTWDKVMTRNSFIDNYAAAGGHLSSIQDSAATIFGNIFGTLEFPTFLTRPAYERLAIGGWQLNSVARFSNGSLINATSNVDVIGNPRSASQTYQRAFNTCYENTAGQPVATVVNPSTGLATLTGCDSLSSAPAFRQRLSFTSQSNSSILNIRQTIYPLQAADLLTHHRHFRRCE